MARAFWRGAISFGMVVIPVKMYVATQSKTVSMHVLHKKCFTQAKQMWYCPVDDEYFPATETVRGYEHVKGQYVVVDENDFKKVPLRTTHAIDIVGFVESQEIDPTYYRDSYYLEPDELGIKPYCLLGDVLTKTKRFGLAKVAFQRREHLSCLRPLDGMLALHTMHYHDEVLPWRDLTPARPRIADEELKMAASLVEAMARKFNPEDYSDEYREALKKVVEAKVKGEEIKVPKAPKLEMPDLMSALRNSIEAAKKESEAKQKLRAMAEKEA